MFNGRIGRGLRIAAVVGIFGAGYVCGTLGQRSTAAAEEPMQGGGSFGAFGDLGRAIIEMQKHIDGLNKELETVRKVNAALGLSPRRQQ